MSDETVKKPDQKKTRSNTFDGYHSAEKCRGCPFGFKTYCVGVCWKDIYKGYPRKRKKQTDK